MDSKRKIIRGITFHNYIHRQILGQSVVMGVTIQINDAREDDPDLYQTYSGIMRLKIAAVEATIKYLSLKKVADRSVREKRALMLLRSWKNGRKKPSHLDMARIVRQPGFDMMTYMASAMLPINFQKVFDESRKARDYLTSEDLYGLYPFLRMSDTKHTWSDDQVAEVRDWMNTVDKQLVGEEWQTLKEIFTEAADRNETVILG